MLRYYTYYSIGGYKDLYLGSSEDKMASTYYLPLLPIIEENAKNDAEAQKEYEKLKDLPRIFQLSDTNNYKLPSSALSLFSHAGYKLIYKHLEGDIHALALRDIECGAKDETGRTIPFLIVITGDTPEDVKQLNYVATYFASYLKETEKDVSSFIGYDKEKNGLCFKLADFNKWLECIVKENKSCKIVTEDSVITVRGAEGKVALITLSGGIDLQCAVKEQSLMSNEIISVEMDKIVSKAETEEIINQLDKTTQELNRAKSLNSLMKKIAVAAGIGGFILGAIIFSCSDK